MSVGHCVRERLLWSAGGGVLRGGRGQWLSGLSLDRFWPAAARSTARFRMQMPGPLAAAQRVRAVGLRRRFVVE